MKMRKTLEDSLYTVDIREKIVDKVWPYIEDGDRESIGDYVREFLLAGTGTNLCNDGTFGLTNKDAVSRLWNKLFKNVPWEYGENNPPYRNRLLHLIRLSPEIFIQEYDRQMKAENDSLAARRAEKEKKTKAAEKVQKCIAGQEAKAEKAKMKIEVAMKEQEAKFKGKGNKKVIEHCPYEFVDGIFQDVQSKGLDMNTVKDFFLYKLSRLAS